MVRRLAPEGGEEQVPPTGLCRISQGSPSSLGGNPLRPPTSLELDKGAIGDDSSLPVPQIKT